MSTTQEQGVPEVLVYADRVVVCGTTVPRPQEIAPSQWLRYWERATDVTYSNVPRWGHR